MLSKDFVVSLVQSNTMIVDASTSIYLPINTPILLGLIQLESVRFHELIVP